MTPFSIRRRARALAGKAIEVVLGPPPAPPRATQKPAENATKRSWELSSQAELIDHIVSHYHANLRRDLPALVDAAVRLEREEAQHPDLPRGLADELSTLSAELIAHMNGEEDLLFPSLRSGARGGPLTMQIRMMERDHTTHAASLTRIRALTANLTAPAGASPTWTKLYADLGALEADLRQHVYLEDGILFARAS